MNITYPGCSLNEEFVILCNKHLTDKIKEHGFERFHPRFIQHYKNVEDAGVVDIGVNCLNSLDIWSDYFPKAFIYGVFPNILETSTFNEKRQKLLNANQNSKVDLNELRLKIDKPVFLIVDDGTHHPEHQIQTFDILFSELLIPGGTYIIEKVETSYWSKNQIYGYDMNYGYHHENSIIELFKYLIDDVNREFLTTTNRIKQSKTLKSYVSILTRLNIGSITFGKNCIIITKKTNEEKDIYDKLQTYQYRFYDNL